MAENSFQIWDDVIHTMPDQMKRIASAKKATTSPSSIDRESKTGVFEGSGKEPYHVTLESCTCGDFRRRKAALQTHVPFGHGIGRVWR